MYVVMGDYNTRRCKRRRVDVSQQACHVGQCEQCTCNQILIAAVLQARRNIGHQAPVDVTTAPGESW